MHLLSGFSPTHLQSLSFEDPCGITTLKEKPTSAHDAEGKDDIVGRLLGATE